MTTQPGEEPNNINELESDDLYQRGKELVPNLDELIKKAMEKGEYLTEREAVNAIVRKNSREKIGTQWINGFWIAYEKSKKGKQMAYVLDKSEGTKTVFFEKSLKVPPKRFAPVKVKVTIVRNLINQQESLEFIKVKPGHLKPADMMDAVASPGMITDKKTYLVAGRVRYVNNIQWDKGQQLKIPKPMFEQSTDGKRTCNLRIALADLSNENSLCNVTIRKMGHLSAIIGKKSVNIIDYFKKVATEDAKLQKLTDQMRTKRLLILGFGSNQNPREEGKQSKSPWLAPGDFGFILSYDKVFEGVKEQVKEQEADIEKEIEQAETKAPPKLKKATRIAVRQMIKSKKATKKSLKLYAKKHKVPKEALTAFIADLIENKKAVVNGEKILPS